MAKRTLTAYVGGRHRGTVVWSDDVTTVVEASLGQIDEEAKVEFSVTPAEQERPYRVLAGDVALNSDEDNIPQLREGSWYWPAKDYFESARGPVTVTLQEADPHNASIAIERVRIAVHVHPSKLGEERFLALLDDLGTISRGLLFDFLGKARMAFTMSSRTAEDPRSKLEELEYLSVTLVELRDRLRRIAADPVRQLSRSVERRSVRGPERLAVSGLRDLACRGIRPGQSRLIAVNVSSYCEKAFESLETTEHRIIRGMLESLAARAKECRRMIEAESAWLKGQVQIVAPGGKGPVFETYERRIEKLGTLRREAARLSREVRLLTGHQVLSASRPSRTAPTTPVFEHVPSYRAVRDTVLRFRRATSAFVDGGLALKLAATSELYEQWVFLQCVAAIADKGFPLLHQKGVASLIRRRLKIALEEGAGVRFAARTPEGKEGEIEVRYEPMIFGKSQASGKCDALYDAFKARRAAPLSPDVLIVFSERDDGKSESSVRHVVALDAKYTRGRIEDKAAELFAKYRGIAAGDVNGPVVRGVFAVWPGARGRGSSAEGDEVALAGDHDMPWTMLPVSGHAVMFPARMSPIETQSGAPTEGRGRQLRACKAALGLVDRILAELEWRPPETGPGRSA